MLGRFRPDTPLLVLVLGVTWELSRLQYIQSLATYEPESGGGQACVLIRHSGSLSVPVPGGAFSFGSASWCQLHRPSPDFWLLGASLGSGDLPQSPGVCDKKIFIHCFS